MYSDEDRGLAGHDSNLTRVENSIKMSSDTRYIYVSYKKTRGASIINIVSKL
jgi:hypothetical protein